MDTIELGNVTVTRVLEWAGPIRTVSEMLPGSDPELVRRHERDLAPDFWEPETDAYRCHVQSWVLRAGGRTIVVDTGVGNDRTRPQVPLFDHLDTGYLAALAAAGVDPAEVDVVVNTHIHYDHVGWNTRLDGGDWVPTFPNARYVIPRADYEFFLPANENARPPVRDEFDALRRRGSRFVFADSVAPVHEAGLSELWEGSYDLGDGLVLEPAPGHTPGSSVLWLTSGTDRAVFVGDLLHSPVQVWDPHCNSVFCEDQDGARASRRAVLERAADTGALVVPAHWPGAGAAQVRRDGSRFAISAWAGFGAPVR